MAYVQRNIRLHGRIENLLSEDYIENVGYLSSGRAIYGGIRASF